MAIDKAVDSALLDNALAATAEKIREKTGRTEDIAFDMEKGTGFADAVGAIQTGGGEGEVVTVSGWVRPPEWPAQPKNWKDEACLYLLIDCKDDYGRFYSNTKQDLYIGITTEDGTFVPDSDEPVSLTNNAIFLQGGDFGDRDYCWIKIIPSEEGQVSVGFNNGTSTPDGLKNNVNTVVEHLIANVRTDMSAIYMDGGQTITHLHAFNCLITGVSNIMYQQTSVKKINLENCTLNDVSFYRAFNGNTQLEELLFDGSTVITNNMANMLGGCSSLKELDLSNWTFTGGDMTLWASNLYNLKQIKLDGFTMTGTPTNNSITASYARALKSIDLSPWANAPIKTITLERCNQLRELSFPDNEWALTGFSIRECSNLVRLDVSNLDLTGVTNMSGGGALWGLGRLKHCSAINAKVSIQFNASPLLTYESLMNIINGLPVVETTQTLTVGSVNTAKLTEDEIAIATAKGWTVA